MLKILQREQSAIFPAQLLEAIHHEPGGDIFFTMYLVDILPHEFGGTLPGYHLHAELDLALQLNNIRARAE